MRYVLDTNVVARLLDGQLSLRRALSDPAGKADDRAALAHRLLR